MRQGSDELHSRREALLLRGAIERQALRDHVEQIDVVIDKIDRGLGMVRRLARPPVLLAGGVLATLLLGRGRIHSTLARGLGLIGLYSRFGGSGRRLAQLFQGRLPGAQASRGDAVRRSR